MFKRFRLPLLLLACCVSAGVFFAGAVADTKSSQNGLIATNLLTAGPDDGRIAYMTATLLERGHYLRHPLDDKYSEYFFDRYIDTLDPQHVHFTQGDLAEFDSYRTNLDDLTLGRGRVADTKPAYEIFGRFVERLQQRTEYADWLLKNEKFEFTTDERMQMDRREASFPRDLDSAKKLWRQRLRSEYLQEKLALIAARKKTETAGKEGEVKTGEVGIEGGKDAPPGSGASTNAVPKTDAEEIADKLSRRYARNLHLFKESDHTDVLEIYLTSLAHVYDPHSDYMSKQQADNFAISMNLSLFGIGATLTTDLDGYCKIQDLKKGGPAMNSGKIKPEDRIVAVAQSNQPPVDIVEMNLNKAVQLIRGPKGTEVRLTVIPAESPSERRVVSLIRDEIKLEDQAANARIIEFTNAPGKSLRLGVIDLPSFYSSINLPGSAGRPEPRSTTDDVERLLKKLQQEHVAGIILDLRSNGGGSLEEAIRLTGLFIKEGPIVQVFGPDMLKPIYDGDPDPKMLYDGPLVVLTSRFSASASEILAGALQDYGRALIVGDIATHGKGTVQSVNPLSRLIRTDGTNDPGDLKLTVRKFYRASGLSTQKRGVMPDIVLPSVLNYSKDIGEDSLDNALEGGSINSVPYEKFNLVAPHLGELLNRSSKRVATNQDFAYVREDIERFRKLQADKTLSLNENERIKEAEENEERQKAREEERLSRNSSKPTIYEITLADCDKVGLPQPLSQTNNIVDPMLDETQRIQMDYISLIKQNGPVVATTDASRKELERRP